MNYLTHFQAAFAYDDWAISKSHESITPEVEQQTSKPRLWLAHTVEARRIWLERLKGGVPSRTVFPDWSLVEIDSHQAESSRDWKQYLSTLSEADLPRTVTYLNTRGEEYKRPLHAILTHLNLHSQHHRGQIASAVREAGGTPAATDFIYYWTPE